MKVYRVSIQGMHGIEHEEFFSSLESAEKRYTALIEEKKRDNVHTLTDEEVKIVGYYSNNFPTFTRLNKQSCLWICRFKYDGHLYIGEKTIIVEQIEVSP